MKTRIRNLFLLPSLIAGLGLILAGGVRAQTFTTLHSFTPVSGNRQANTDGATPYAGLILSSNTLYGTAYSGGLFGYGTLFKVNTDGTHFTILHTFAGHPTDGANPYSGLILSGNTLYGTTEQGGSSGNGTVFALNTDGSDFRILYSFSGGDGSFPRAMILSTNTLYGTTIFGGSSDFGTVFTLNTDGSGLTTLYSFTDGDEGQRPGALILSDNTLYGTSGGSSTFLSSGAVFAVNTDGTGFTLLHTFSPLSNNGYDGTNSDGASPNGLILSGNILYGTAYRGGSSRSGTLFAVNIDGTSFTILHTFAGYPTDGTYPQDEGGLLLSGGTLYGTTRGGGSSDGGTVFSVNTDGTGFVNLHTFTGGSDGSSPTAGPILSGNSFFGTASGGGSYGYGTIFSLSFAPRLSIIPSGANMILTWPTNYAGFDYGGYTLQSTTNLAPSAVWTAVSPAPVVLNGQNTVTNPIAGTKQFYRLIQ